MSRRSQRGRPRREGAEPEQVLYVGEGASPGQPVWLEGSEADHARRSLRLHSGDPVALVDGAGMRYHGRVAGLDKHGIQVLVDTGEQLPAWPSRRIWLGAGVLRSTRMDVAVEKASELGVARLTPLVLKHCVARPHDEGTKLDRWHRLAIESLKQSRRARLLEVDSPVDLDGFLETLPPGRTLWVADPRGADPLDAVREVGADPLVLVVGPEGGLAEDERGILERAGARFLGLGGHRLRAETAAIALVTVALTALGEMGDPSKRV